MGEGGLATLVEKLCPEAITSARNMRNFSGKVIAVDAANYLHQFLATKEVAKLSEEPGDTGTSHLEGTFFTNIELLHNGLKPVYIFDGKSSEAKQELLHSLPRGMQAASDRLKIPEDNGGSTPVKVEKHHEEESKKLLKMMGTPYLEAPGEATAQCAALVRAGKAYATASEDVDSLIFGSSVLIRHLESKTNKKKVIIKELILDKIISGLGIDIKQLIDLSILLGCKYCKGIEKFTPTRAINFIRKYKNIETILNNINRKVYKIPEEWKYEDVRRKFLNPLVIKCDQMEFQWSPLEKHRIFEYLCEEKNINQISVHNALVKYTFF